jgi:hypothetical protein
MDFMLAQQIKGIAGKLRTARKHGQSMQINAPGKTWFRVQLYFGAGF